MNYFPFIYSSKGMSCVWGWVYSSWRCLKSTFRPWTTCWAALLSSPSQVTGHTPAFCCETILHGSFMFPNALWADALIDLYCKNALSSQGYLNREYKCKFQSVNEIHNSGSQPGMVLAMSEVIFACHKWGRDANSVWWQRPEMLPNILQFTETSPTVNNYSSQNVPGA